MTPRRRATMKHPCRLSCDNYSEDMKPPYRLSCDNYGEDMNHLENNFEQTGIEPSK